MYQVSHSTYLMSAVLSIGLSGNPVVCSNTEILKFSPSTGRPVELISANINLLSPESTSECQICAIQNTDKFLASLSINYYDRWRNIRLMFVYVGFKIVAALLLLLGFLGS